VSGVVAAARRLVFLTAAAGRRPPGTARASLPNGSNAGGFVLTIPRRLRGRAAGVPSGRDWSGVHDILVGSEKDG
jgi:hypothetical protein